MVADTFAALAETAGLEESVSRGDGFLGIALALRDPSLEARDDGVNGVA